jgi:short-subunit dehydrogenase
MKNVVITGASTGLGYAIASAFAREGNQLILISKTPSKLAAATERLQKEYTVNITSYAADLSDKKATIDVGKQILKEFNKIDILVNNAGSYVPGAIYNEPDGQIEFMIKTNLYSAYHLTRTLMPAFEKQSSGHIFNMCSIASLQAYANGGSYSISKFALAGFTKNLREELKPLGIKVTGVYPGAAYTDSWKGSGVEESRLMTADDVAEMIFSASKLSVQACVEEIVLRPQLGDL